MKRSPTLGLRLFTSAFLILFTFAQPLLAIESLTPVQDAATTIDENQDILDEGISDPEEIAKPVWVTSGESATTSSPVVLGETYVYPINPAVTVTFSKLPIVSDVIMIKTVYLTDEQVKATNAASNVAYDIATGMDDGTFEYDLTLPRVGDSDKVIYAESVSGLTDAKDINNVVKNSNSLEITGLNHFTVFVVIDDGDANFAAPGWSSHGSGYNGDHRWVNSSFTGSEATWTYTGASITGGAAIFVSWTQWNDHATNAMYTSPLFSGFEVNQKLNSAQSVTDGNGVWSSWYRVPGSFTNIPTGTTVSLGVQSGATNGNLSADAVAFVDLNEAPMTVWVDDNYSVNNTGYHFWGYDAFNNLQSALAAVAAGGVINIANGTYVENGQIIVNKNVSIVGESKDNVIIKPNGNTGSAGDARAWILVNDGKEFNLKNVTLDGAEKSISIGLLSHGTGVIDNNIIKNMVYPGYAGRGIALYGTTTTVSNNIIQNFGRIGIFTYGTSTPVISNNTITGKGEGDHLDYAVEVGGGSNAIINNNNLSNCKGIASDHSTSAGILGTTTYGTGSSATISNNYIHNNHLGMAFGYSTGDTTSIILNSNSFADNDIDLDNGTVNNIDARSTLLWSVENQNDLDQIEAKIYHNCPASIYAHGLCNDIEYGDGFGFVQYKNVETPINLGWNVASKSTTPNENPLDLVCTSIGSVYTNENSVAQNWSAVSGLNIKYQREVTYPTGSIGFFEAGSIANTPFASFGSGTGTEGLWKTRVKAYVDVNMNGRLDSGEESSQWSNSCSITLDKTTPTISNVNVDKTFVKAGDTVTITADVTDNTGVLAVSADFATNEDYSSTSRTTPSSISISLVSGNTYSATFVIPADWADGQIFVKVAARDLTGDNWVRSTEYKTFLVDNTAPTNPEMLGFNNPTLSCGAITKSKYVTVDWSDSSDLGSGVKGYNYKIDYPTTSGGRGEYNAFFTTSQYRGSLNEGIHYIKVRAVDNAGNVSAWTDLCSITLDTIAPEVPVLVSPVDGIYTKGTSVTNVWSDTSTDVAYYNYESYHDEALTNRRWAETFTSTSKTATNIADATFWWRVQAVDFAGNKSAWSEAWKITVDNIAPASQFAPNVTEQYNNSEIVLQGSTTDLNGVTEVNLYFKPTGPSDDWTWFKTISNSPLNSTSFAWATTWTPEYQGTYDIKASGTDIAGNIEGSAIMTGIIFDTEDPNVQNLRINYQYFATYVNGRTGFLVSVPVSDTLSGINQSTCKFTLNHGWTWLNGEYAYDMFLGNVCRFWADSSILTDNTDLDIRAKVSDNAGNIQKSNIVETTVDKELASSRAIIDNNYYGPYSSPVIKGRAWDTVSNITNVMITLSRDSDGKYWNGNWFLGSMWSGMPTMYDTDGTSNWNYNGWLPRNMQNGEEYIITPYAWDEVHLTTQAGRVDSFIWDSTLPQDPTRIWSPSHTSAPNDDRTIDIRFSGANDDLSGVKGYYYSFSNTPETPSTNSWNWLPYGSNRVTSRNLPDGIWYFNIRTVDNVGNMTSTAHSSAFIVDTTAPAAPVISSPISGQYFNSQPILNAWNEVYDLNGIQFYKVEYKYDDGHAVPNGKYRITTISERNHIPQDWEQGGVSFRVQATDNAGNVGPWSGWVHYYFDKTAPSKPVITNTTAFTKVNALIVNWTGGDDTAYANSTGAGIAAYSMRYVFTPADGSADIDWTSGWVTSGNPKTRSGLFDYGEGKYVIYVKTIDMANNESPESEPYTITYDKTAPDVQITTPTAGFVGGTVEIRGTVTDANPHHYWFVITNNSNGAQVAGLNTVPDTTSFENKFLMNWNTNGLDDGQYTIKLEARDSADNKDSGSVQWLVVTVDNTTPVTTATGIDTLWHNTDVTVTLTCDDTSGSGCYKTYYSLNGEAEQEGNTVIVSAEGLNTIKFHSEDNAGNVETEQTSQDVKIDKIDPTGDIFGFNTFTFGRAPSTILTLTDNNELAQVCYSLDGVVQPCVNITGTTYSWDITSIINALAIGNPHTFAYTVEDTAGNKSDSNALVEGNDAYSASFAVTPVPQQAQVRGAATVATLIPEAVQGVQTTEEEKTTTPVTQEEIKGVQDTNEEETSGKPIPWWVYVIGGAALLSFIIFLIARRRKEEEGQY